MKKSLLGGGKPAHASAGGDAAELGRREKAVCAIVPLLVPFVLLCVVSLLVYPMLNASPRGIQVAICSEDAGVETPAGCFNAGDMMIDKMTGAAGEADESDGAAIDADGTEEADDEGSSAMVSSDAIEWLVYDSADELRAAMDNNEYYAAMFIPADFSENMMATSLATYEAMSGLAEGVTTLSEGAGNLSSGVQTFATGVGTLASGTDGLATGVGTLAEKVSALPQVAAGLVAGSQAVGTALESVNTLLASDEFAAAVAAAQEGDPTAFDAYMTQVNAALAGAAQANAGVSQGAAGMSAAADGLVTGVNNLNTGVSGLNTAAGKLAEGAATLATGTGALATGTGKLADGLNDMVDTLETKMVEALDAAASGETLAASDSEDDSEDAASAATIELVVNQGKNPMVATSIGSAVSSMGGSTGVSFETTYLNPVGGGYSGMLSAMVMVICIFLPTIASSIILATLRPISRKSAGKVAVSWLVQLLYVAMISCIIGCGVAFIVGQFSSLAFDVAKMAAFMSLSAFMFMLIVVSCVNLFGTPGVAIPVLMFMLGMACCNLPYEFLPDFWQSYVYPWMPLRFIAEGSRAILFMGADVMSASTVGVLIAMAVGAVLALLALAKAVVSAKKGAEVEAA